MPGSPLVLVAGLALAMLCACATTSGTEGARAGIRSRTGASVDPDRSASDPATIPAGVRVDDGLSAEEAVAVALWNSPSLRVDLARLTAADADLAQARRPANPTLRFLFPAGPQQLSVLLTWPLETLITMPRRIRWARRSRESTANSVVQTGLDLSRDVRLGHADWVLAAERLEVREAIAAQWLEIAAIAEARAQAGEVAVRDAEAARADARVAEDDAVRAQGDVALAWARLVVLLGWGRVGLALVPQSQAGGPTPVAALNVLTDRALAQRPDLRAAALSIEAAGARVGLERAAVFTLAGVGYGVGSAYTGGVQAELPIASQNQGGIGRARAQLEAATWRYRELRERIVGEVAQASVQLQRAERSSAAYRDAIVGARARDLEAATAQYELGETDYGEVLLSAQRLEQARLREVELAADERRAAAELDRALGGRATAVDPIAAQESR